LYTAAAALGTCSRDLSPRTSDRAPAEVQWTLLVQGWNLELPEADALLRRFRFLPYARLDDVMVSYGRRRRRVGPHFDSYDVFFFKVRGDGRVEHR